MSLLLCFSPIPCHLHHHWSCPAPSLFCWSCSQVLVSLVTISAWIYTVHNYTYVSLNHGSTLPLTSITSSKSSFVFFLHHLHCVVSFSQILGLIGICLLIANLCYLCWKFCSMSTTFLVVCDWGELSHNSILFPFIIMFSFTFPVTNITCLLLYF